LLELVARDCPCNDEIRFLAPARFEAILDQAILDQVGVRTPRIDLVAALSLVALSRDAIGLALPYEPRTRFVRVASEDLVGSGHASCNQRPRNQRPRNQRPRNLVEWRWR
jgi:hypothetical protein